jgi:MinD-like ATPase involved in chromosome partitioning or flagellar assembly
MTPILSIHSFRRGTGKSTTIVNLAVLLAMAGRRVGVIDANVPLPSLHILFGLEEHKIAYALNDYLVGSCPLGAAAYNVSASLEGPIPGAIFLIPASSTPRKIAQVLEQGYDVPRLAQGIGTVVKDLRLDVVLMDTAGGLNEDTVLAMVLSDVVAIMLRPDQQDYQGTAVTVEVARKLDVPYLRLVVNEVPALLDPAQLEGQVEHVYACRVAAVLPDADELRSLASTGIFVLRYPDHPLTTLYQRVAAQLVEEASR